MLKKIINHYKFVEFFQSYLISSYCLSLDEYESVLHLDYPRLLLDLNQSEYVVSNSEPISLLQIHNNNISDIKADRKSKSHNKSLDNLENKKNKQKKKLRAKIHLNEDFSHSSHNLDLSNQSEISLIRSPRSIKQKKDQKLNSKNISTLFSDQEKRVNKEIIFNRLLTIEDLSKSMHIPSAEIIKWLFLQGISITINQFIDISICKLVANHYNFKIINDKNSKVLIKNSIKKEQNLRAETSEFRAPIITVFGHVDHGKTTLLNALKNNNSLILEAGNITQSIVAYEVELSANYKVSKLIFLDTPGHEAFVGMRERGAQITDLAILVVAADDGLKPQTIEAINHIKEHKIPFVVALNKIDKLNINAQKVKQQLAKYDILDKDWGGSVPIIEVSAITGKNINLLLSSLLQLFEYQDYRTDISKPAEGFILESSLDRQKGPIAHIILQKGTLSVGDILVAGNTYAKVKAILNSKKNKVLSVHSVSVVEILGFSVVPRIGLIFKSVPNEKLAKFYALEYKDLNILDQKLNTRIQLHSMHNNRKTIKQVNVILKADTQGSIEAIINAFEQIPQQKVQINILFASASEISGKDIELASTSNAIILAFNINLSSRHIPKNTKLIIKEFSIIYDLVDYIRNYMLTFVDLVYKKENLGKAEVKTVFEVKKGAVAGCFVLYGKLKKNALITVRRKQVIVYEGKLNSLKKLKEDVQEVTMNNECGIMCYDYHLWHEKDEIDAYELKVGEKNL
uniref:Translation initiation factor IF-2, chloroplastic n=1 Tax=Sporolithon durum TaxID=48970 RepID=A0A141SCS9_9FLOR|nr:translation initiation factor 2 [Sporolithon durum]AMK96097.1 translation initiation factor 2 [Sporolithon durum]